MTLRAIFHQWPKLCIELDVEADIQILKGIYIIYITEPKTIEN